MDFHFVVPLHSPVAVSQSVGSEGMPASTYFSEIIHADYTYAMAVLNHVYLWSVHGIQAPLSVFLFMRKIRSEAAMESIALVRRLMGDHEVEEEKEGESKASTLPPYFLAFGFMDNITHDTDSHYCIRINLFPRRDLQYCMTLWRRYVQNIETWIPETQFYRHLTGEGELLSEDDVLAHLSELGRVCRVEGCQAYAELGSCCKGNTYLTSCLFIASNYVRPAFHVLHNSNSGGGGGGVVLPNSPDMHYMA